MLASVNVLRKEPLLTQVYLYKLFPEKVFTKILKFDDEGF